VTLGVFDHPRSDGPPWSSANNRQRRTWTVFGRESVYVAGLYLRRGFLFSGIALSIILALDVAGRMADVLSLHGGAAGLVSLSALASYIALRAAFVVPSIFPVAAIMGVIWAEFGLARSHERTMIFSSGRAPVHSLMPALLFGAVIGLVQFTALNFSRPFSTEVQGQSHYRYYGPRYVGASTKEAKWFVTEDAVFNAQIEFGPPVVLHDVVVYRLAPSGLLESIISAAHASPMLEDGIWEFRSGRIWEFKWEQGDRLRYAAPTEFDFETKELPVSLDPLWAEYVDVDPRLLPLRILHNLATAGSGIPNSVTFRIAYHERYATVLTSIAMALIGASLSLLMFSPHVNPMKLIQIASIGYGVHVGSTSLVLLGEHGLVPLVLAVWLLPLSIIIGSFLLLYRHDLRVQNAIAYQAG
jgi:lipopolysaccharide export system permease protein